MTPHETPPKELRHAILLICHLVWLRRNNAPGSGMDVVESSISYANMLFRHWVQNQDAEYYRMSALSNEKYSAFAYRFWRGVQNYHRNLLEKIANKIREIKDTQDKIKLYNTLPFPAPKHLQTEIETDCYQLREYWAKYWHIANWSNPPAWTYEQMVTMLETKELIEVEYADQ